MQKRHSKNKRSDSRVNPQAMTRSSKGAKKRRSRSNRSRSRVMRYRSTTFDWKSTYLTNSVYVYKIKCQDDVNVPFSLWKVAEASDYFSNQANFMSILNNKSTKLDLHSDVVQTIIDVFHEKEEVKELDDEEKWFWFVMIISTDFFQVTGGIQEELKVVCSKYERKLYEKLKDDIQNNETKKRAIEIIEYLLFVLRNPAPNMQLIERDELLRLEQNVEYKKFLQERKTRQKKEEEAAGMRARQELTKAEVDRMRAQLERFGITFSRDSTRKSSSG